MQSSLRIAIVGCGSAGPAAGILLARAGHEVSLYERATELKPVGAGFMIQPTGQTVLAQLGILDKLAASASELTGLVCHTRSGRTLLDLSYADVDSNYFGLGVQRRLLLDVLCDAMKDSGVALHLGRELVSIQGDCLVFENNSQAGPFDLIVGADGPRSKVRECVPLRYRAKPYPWGALWFMAEDNEPVAYLDQVVHGARTMLGLLPSGRSSFGEPSKTSLFWSLRNTDYKAWKEQGIEAWKKEVVRLMPRASHLLTEIDSPEDLTMARYWDVRMSRFSHGTTVLIGDAAHATSPQLGQGVNLGLWDAMVLASMIGEHATLPDALGAFEAERKAPLAYYQWATRFLTPFFQSNSRTLAFMRDLAMPIANRIGPMRRQMITTMAGVKRGFVRSSIALPNGEAKSLLGPGSS